MKMTRVVKCRLGIAVLSVLCAGCGSSGMGAREQTGEMNLEPQQCIAFSRIENIEIVDDDTIVYFTNRQTYRNTLVSTCYGISGFTDRNAFSYGVTNNVRMRNLCSGDAVGVLNLDSQQSRSCELGEFVPVTDAEADTLLGR